MAALLSDLESVTPSMYLKEVMEEYKNIKDKTNTTQKDFMTKQWVDIMIQRIIAAEAIVNKDGYTSLHESIKTTLRTYLVDTTKSSKKTLILKPIPGKEHKSKTIVPLEESYEVVQKAHNLTNHGTCQEMEVWILNNNYLMHKMCLETYCKLCKKCNRPQVIEQNIEEQNMAVQSITGVIGNNNNNQNSALEEENNEESFDHVSSVDVLDISNNPDLFYSHLLIYQDRKTNFIQLRPLTNNSETEIAMELIKIIMDLGPPECIVVDADNKTIFQKLLDRVKILANSDIALTFHKSENKLIQIVAKNIISWMKQEDCKNWGTGCHVVQWNMNNESDSRGNTPFSRVFGNKYTGFGYKSKFIHQVPVNDNSDDDILALTEDEEDVKRNPDEDEEQSTSSQNLIRTITDEDAFLVTMTENDVKTEPLDPEIIIVDNLN